MNVSDCFSCLTSTYNDWGDFFVNRRFYKADGVISWAGNAAPRHSSLLGADEFARLVENQQYSFQSIADGSIFRLFYRFDNRGRQIQAASLSYVAPPSDLEFCNGTSDSGDYEGLCRWLRVDFDGELHRVPNHAACHLHLSGMPSARIPISRVPTPRQFIGWVMSLTSPDSHDELFATDGSIERLNAPAFTEHWSAGLKGWIHVAVPPYAAL